MIMSAKSSDGLFRMVRRALLCHGSTVGQPSGNESGAGGTSSTNKLAPRKSVVTVE
jgi:hypothetical protein